MAMRKAILTLKNRSRPSPDQKWFQRWRRSTGRSLICSDSDRGSPADFKRIDMGNPKL